MKQTKAKSGERRAKIKERREERMMMRIGEDGDERWTAALTRREQNLTLPRENCEITAMPETAEGMGERWRKRALGD